MKFYVGLKPYDDPSWKTTAIHNKPELTEDIQKQLSAFPGVIFNYTQPAEDAVDEALTGLKSALAIQGDPDLEFSRARRSRSSAACRRCRDSSAVVRELEQPSLVIDVDRDKVLAMASSIRGCRGCRAGGCGRTSRDPGDQGEKLNLPICGADEA